MRRRRGVRIKTTGSGVNPSPIRPDATPTPAVWSDSSTVPRTPRPTPSKWTADLGGGGWESELETYTNSVDNVHLAAADI